LTFFFDHPLIILAWSARYRFMLLHGIINFVNATLSDVTDDLRYDDKWYEINPFLLFGENNTNVLNAYFKSPKKQ
jgi:hypothetical protein